MSNYIFVFYFLHLLFCLIYYFFLARKEKLAMTLFPLVIFIPYVGFIGITTYFIAVKINDRTESLALDEIILPIEHMEFVGLESREKINKTVPVEEALKINDVEVQREIVMEVAKRDPQQYLETLKQALLSEDSETSHYAATSITKLKRVLDKKLLGAKEEYGNNKDDENTRSEYIEALDAVIKSELSVDSILDEYTKGIIETLIDDIKRSKKGNRKHYRLLIEYLNQTKLFRQATMWADLYKKEYSDEDDPLRLMLKIGYDSNDENLFKKAAQLIKSADFPVRKATLDLVEYFEGITIG